MADNEVGLSVNVLVDEAIRSINNLEKATQKSVSNMESAFGGLKTIAVAALGFIAGKEVIDFFEESTKAAAKQEVEVARLEASLKSLGDFTPEAVEDFKEFAETLQKTSVFSDEAALSALAYAKQLGLTNDKAKELVTASAGVATVMHTTLDEAVSELGRTLTGTIGRLAKYAPETKLFTEEQLKAGAAIDFFGNRLKHAAEDAIQTYSGALIQLGNSQEDFKKQIGSLITQNPLVVASIKTLRDIFNDLTNYVKNNKEKVQDLVTQGIKVLLDTIPLVLEGLGAFLSALGFVAEGFTYILLGLNKLRSSFQDFTVFMHLAKKEFDFDKEAESIFGFGEKTTNGFKKSSEAIANFSTLAQGYIDKIKKADNEQEKAALAAKLAEEIKSQAKIKALNEEATAKLKDAAANKIQQDELDKLTVKFEEFKKRVLDKQVDDIKKINFERQDSLKKLQEFEDEGVDKTKEASELRRIINAKAEQDIKEARRKTFEEFKRDVSNAASYPLTIAFDSQNFDVPKIGKDFAKGIAAGLGTLSDILKGAAGAESLVKAAATALGDAIIPGIGPVVGEIVGVLGKGKDQTIAFIKQFSDALPSILENLIEALPYVMPEVATSLVDSLVSGGGIKRIAVELIQNMAKQNGILFQAGRQLAIGLAEGLGQSYKDGAHQFAAAIKDNAPYVKQYIIDGFNNSIEAVRNAFATFADTFRDAFNQLFGGIVANIKAGITDGFTDGIKSIYASIGNAIVDGFRFAFSELGSTIIKAFQDAVDAVYNKLKDAVTPGSGGVLGGFNPVNVLAGGATGVPLPAVNQARKTLGLASGGVIPSGYPNDTFPARLSSGEAVVPNDVVGKLDSFLNNGSMTDALLMKLLAAVEKPQTIQTSINIGSRELATAILELTRQNARLSA